MLPSFGRHVPATRPFALVLALCALLVGALVLTPAPANAASATEGGTVAAGNPTYRPVNPGTCVPGSEDRPYVVLKATLNGAAASTLNITVNPNGFRAHVALYQGVFLPENPMVNCFIHPALSATAGGEARMSTPLSQLLPGFTSQDFYVVVSGVSSTDTGSFTATIESTNATSVVIDGQTGPAPDTTAPVLHLPSSVSGEATSASGGAVTATVTAVDDRDGNRPVTCSPALNSTFPLGSTNVSCSASDLSGNKSTGSFTVTIRDTVGPVITITPGANPVEATGPGGAAITYTATARDAVDGDRPVSCAPVSGTTAALGRTTVTCTAEDTRSNDSTKTLDITVHDTTPPVLDVPDDMTVEATGPGGALVDFATTATDLVDGDLTPACGPASGSTFALGTTEVTCTTTDAASNTATESFDVDVVDTTAPVVTAPIDLNVEAPSGSGALVEFDATASDAVDGALTPTCLPASGTRFPLGATTVTCTATDAADNTGSTNFEVTVTDAEGPVLSLPSDITVEATDGGGAVVDYVATASDAVDGDLTPNCTPASGTSFALGTTTVTCTATDAADNISQGSFTVTVSDTTDPTLDLPSDIVAEATGPDGAPVDFVATATDLVDGALTPDCAPAGGSTFPLGTTQVSCTATDAGGNTASGSFQVQVRDTTMPTITAPTDLAVDRPGPDGASVTYDATATDLVDGAITPTCSPPSGTTFTTGSTEVTCVATDAASNSATVVFEVIVGPGVAPVLTLPGDLTLEATGPDGAAADYDTAAVDSTGATIPVTCSATSGDTFPIGTTTVDCSATDDRDNEASGSFTVLVQDTTGPVIEVPQKTVVAEATSARGARVTFDVAAVDAVHGSVPVRCTPESGSMFEVGRTTVRCTATDTHAGRVRARVTSTATFDVMVRPYRPDAPTGGGDDDATASSGLPDAGSPVHASWLGLGAGLVAVGALLLGASRRRRTC